MFEQDKAPEAETPPADDSDVSRETSDAPERTENEHDPDHEFVKFQDPATERRFKHVWKQMRESERVNGQLAADNKALLERLEAVEQNVTQATANTEITQLRAQKVQALESGDWERAAAIDEAILDLKVKAQAKPAAKPEMNGHDKGTGGLTPDDQAFVEHWSRERNEDGSARRPWASPGHPEHRRAQRAIATIAGDEEFSNAPLQDILDEVDRMMGTAKGRKPAAGAVLSSDGNASAGRNSKTPKLSEEQKIVAAKMGLSPEQYAKAMQKYSGGGGLA